VGRHGSARIGARLIHRYDTLSSGLYAVLVLAQQGPDDKDYLTFVHGCRLNLPGSFAAYPYVRKIFVKRLGVRLRWKQEDWRVRGQPYGAPSVFDDCEPVCAGVGRFNSLCARCLISKGIKE